MRQWEIIADNLKERGWSWGYVSAVDSEGRMIWIADAHRDGKRFVVRADEKLTALVDFESAESGLQHQIKAWWPKRSARRHQNQAIQSPPAMSAMRFFSNKWPTHDT